MRNEHIRNLEAVNAINAARTTLDTVSPVEEIGRIAADAVLEGRLDAAHEIMASIAPIKLGRTTYTVAAAGRCGMTLIGPRGGCKYFVPCLKSPTQWALVHSANRTEWYRRNEDGTFTAI